jgi:hypothetical protein
MSAVKIMRISISCLLKRITLYAPLIGVSFHLGVMCTTFGVPFSKAVIFTNNWCTCVKIQYVHQKLVQPSKKSLFTPFFSKKGRYLKVSRKSVQWRP